MAGVFRSFLVAWFSFKLHRLIGGGGMSMLYGYVVCCWMVLKFFMVDHASLNSKVQTHLFFSLPTVVPLFRNCLLVGKAAGESLQVHTFASTQPRRVGRVFWWGAQGKENCRHFTQTAHRTHEARYGRTLCYYFFKQVSL